MLEEKEQEIKTVRIGDTITISLQSNATTGYRWYLKKYDTTKLKLTVEQYHSSCGDKLGAPGHQTFTFIALSEDTTELHFVYKKIWEEETESNETYKIQIKITK